MLLEFKYLKHSPRTTFIIITIQESLTTVCSLENVVIYSNLIIRGIEEPRLCIKEQEMTKEL